MIFRVITTKLTAISSIKINFQMLRFLKHNVGPNLCSVKENLH